MKLNRRSLRRLIESVINEGPFDGDDPFNDTDDPFNDTDDTDNFLDDEISNSKDTSNYPATKKEATSGFIKRTEQEAADLKAKILKDEGQGLSGRELLKIRSKANHAYSNHLASRGIIQLSGTGNYRITTQEGETVAYSKEEVNSATLKESRYYRRRLRY